MRRYPTASATYSNDRSDLPGGPAVVVYRSKDGLGVQCPGEFRVDNKPCRGRCELPLPSVVACERFTFALEPVEPRL